MSDERLMQYFKFTKFDLACNRLGLLTHHQRLRTGARPFLYVLTEQIILWGSYLGSFYLIGRMIYLIRRDTLQNIDLTWDIREILLLGVFGLLIFIIACNVLRIWLKRPIYQVKHVQGPVKITQESFNREGYQGIRYDLVVDDKKFEVDSKLGDILTQEGDTFQVHYSHEKKSGMEKVQSVELTPKE
ncbi:MAG TPA: hypothetical protein VN376_09710 [Longilinea sp.]|nr:hypothetical protein [Longilinea sp.]